MKTNRRTGIELLRIIAMFAIVLGHFVAHSNGFTTAISIKNPLVIAERMVESFGLFKVNVFILITGFFMIEKQMDFSQIKKRLFPLWRQVFGYSVVILIVMFVFFRPSIIETIKSFFPILCYRYWFITTYFVLIILTPIINRAFHNIEEKSMRKIVLAIVGCFALWQTIMPFVTTVDDMKGYSIIWFVVVYIIGGYIKKFGINLVNNKLRIPLYLLMSVCYLGYSYAVELFSAKVNIKVNIPYYNSIFALVASIALFNFFLKININGKIGRVISYLSGSVIAIYLISDNPLVRGVLYNNILHIDKYINHGIKSILIILLLALIVFVVCLCIDILRRSLVELFRKINNNIKSEG